MAGVFYFPLVGTPTAEGNQLFFYVAGTDQPLDVWTDSDLTLAYAQPIILNADGETDGPIYVSPSPSYKVRYEDENGVAIAGYPVDFVSPSTITAAWSGLRTMITVEIPLTNAQIKLLPTTPFTIVSAPTTSLRIRPLACSLKTNFTAGAYTNVNTTQATLQLQTPNGDYLSGLIVNDGSTSTHITRLTTFFNAAQQRMVDLVVPYAAAFDAGSTSGIGEWPDLIVGTDPASTNAKALQLGMFNNGSGVLTGGNVANTLVVTLYYVLQSVS